MAMPLRELLTFNIDNGYLEGYARGIKSGLLNKSDYHNLEQCKTLDDIKLHLQSTDFGADFLANEPSPLSVATIDAAAKRKFVAEFEYIRQQASEPLSTFLDFITYSYMIDNVILLITGTSHQRPVEELMPKCHSLGRFPQLEAINIATTAAGEMPRRRGRRRVSPFFFPHTELYNAVLIDTPLAPFFRHCLSGSGVDEINMERSEHELIRNQLHKSYLEAFHDMCRKLGGVTADVVCDMLAFEADRRCFTITINSFGTELSRDERARLFPRCGLLHPVGLDRLANATDFDQVRLVADRYVQYKALFDSACEGGGQDVDRTLEDCFIEREVSLANNCFMRQFHFGIFYALVKLKEQESRNIASRNLRGLANA